MAQPPIEVDQISSLPAFDGTNISNVDAISLGGTSAASFAPLASPSFTGTVNATDLVVLNSSGDSRIRIQGASPGDNARLNFHDGAGSIQGQMFLRGSDDAMLLISTSGDLFISTTADGTDVVISTNPAKNDNIILDGQRFPNQDGTAGQRLQTDGAGNLSWETPSIPTYKTKTGNTSRASTITLTADPNLAGFALQPSSSYKVECNLLVQGNGSTTNGWKGGLDFNGQDVNATVVRPFVHAGDVVGSFSTSYNSFEAVSLFETSAPLNINTFRSGVSLILNITAIVETNSSYVAGTIMDLVWAQFASSATATALNQFSTMVVTKIEAP